MTMKFYHTEEAKQKMREARKKQSQKEIIMSFKHLISEDGKNVSLGRLSFWIIFIISLYMWIYLKKEIFEYQAQIFIALLLYNLGKKGLSAWSTFKGKKEEVTSNVTPIQIV